MGHAAAAVLGSLVALTAVMDVSGSQISVFASLMFHLKRRAGRSRAPSLVPSLAGSLGVHHGFDQGLMVQLPPPAPSPGRGRLRDHHDRRLRHDRQGRAGVALTRFLTGTRTRAVRRAMEMRDTGAYLNVLGVPAEMTRAAEQTLRRLSAG
ncbi:DUF1932 domain-containing protein [Nonomuraea jabiensis]|uniref:DUF1932 domain-containing protein n=1 Tax=Nonomuraea jabiensis TaxID=882448 RepID=UPI0036C67A45